MGPADIAGRQFSVGDHGYAQQEVDTFLEAVARKLGELDATVAAREATLARSRQCPDTAERRRLLRRLGEEAVAMLDEAEAATDRQRAEVDEVRREIRAGLQRVAEALGGAHTTLAGVVRGLNDPDAVDITEELEETASAPAEASPPAPPNPPAAAPARPPATPDRPAAGTPPGRHGDRGVTVALTGLTALAWAALFRATESMRETASGLGRIGQAPPDETGVPGLLAVWTLMMVAMTVPLMVPGLRPGPARAAGTRRSRARVTVAFAAGYVAVWIPIGLLTPLALAWFRALSPSSVWPSALAGVVLVTAGFYQLTPWRGRSPAGPGPLAGILQNPAAWNTGASFREGLDDGLKTVVRLAPLLAVLLVFGLANLAVAAVLTAVFLVDSRAGWPVFDRAVGTALIMLGVVVSAFPGVLHTLSGG